MIRHGMRPRRFTGPALPIIVLAASQVGHLLASELRAGPRTGAHGYVPALTTVALGVAGATVLAGILAVAAAHVARMGPRAALLPGSRPRLLDVSAVLFALQFALFLAQETLEAAACGAALPDIAGLLLWGCLGQLPVAVLAAVVVRWLTSSVEAAVAELVARTGQPLAAGAALAPVRRWTAARPALRCRPRARAASGRGPPKLLCPAG